MPDMGRGTINRNTRKVEFPSLSIVMSGFVGGRAIHPHARPFFWTRWFFRKAFIALAFSFAGITCRLGIKVWARWEMHGWLGYSECVLALRIRINRQKKSNEVAVQRIVCPKNSRASILYAIRFSARIGAMWPASLKKGRNETAYSLYNGPSLPGRWGDFPILSQGRFIQQKIYHGTYYPLVMRGGSYGIQSEKSPA